VKNFSIGSFRSPSGPRRRTSASSATSAGARSLGWTMYEGPPPRIALYLFSPLCEKHSEPPFLMHLACSLR
jgi:hypothetical protein